MNSESLHKKTMKLYINGKIVHEKEAKISPNDQGLLIGDGVFETLRTVNQKLLFYDEHYSRLYLSAQELEIQFDISKKDLQEAIYSTIKANKLTESRVRITLTKGVKYFESDKENIKPTVIINTVPLTIPDVKGARVICLPLERALPHIKSTSYQVCAIAKAKAEKKGAIEAILIDRTGFVREGSYSNFFIVEGKMIITPKDYILSGITRKHVLKIAEKLNIKTEERDVSFKELSKCKELFLTSSIVGVVPVFQIDGREIDRGEVTDKILEYYESNVLNLKRII
jgi:D-amino acid aminotransferase